MRCSGLHIFSFVILLLATTAVIVAFSTSYWSIPNGDAMIAGIQKFTHADLEYSHRGILRECFGISVKSADDGASSKIKQAAGDAKHDMECALKGNCKGCFSYFDKEDYKSVMKEKNHEKLGIAALEVAIVALVGLSAVIGLLALIVSPCCCSSCGICLTNLVLSAAIFGTAGIGAYAYQHFQVLDYAVGELAWSFWLAVGGVAGQYFAVLFFAIAACQLKREYSAI